MNTFNWSRSEAPLPANQQSASRTSPGRSFPRLFFILNIFVVSNFSKIIRSFARWNPDLLDLQ